MKQFQIVLTIFVLAGLVVLYFIRPEGAKLPVFGPQDFNPELVDASVGAKKESHVVLDFKLVNQNGETITQSDYEGKVYVADFFFTRCPSICPVMTSNMKKVQEAYLNDDNVKLLSLSVTPEMDSIPILKTYALRNGVLDSKWNVTTGDKKHIYHLARKSYFAAVDYGDGGLQDFIHTPNFVLVDQKKHIRGVYDGTNEDEVLRLITDIKTLIQ